MSWRRKGSLVYVTMFEGGHRNRARSQSRPGIVHERVRAHAGRVRCFDGYRDIGD